MAASAETEQSDELVGGKEGERPTSAHHKLAMAAHAMFLLVVKCLQQANEKDKGRDLEVLIDGVVKIQ